jgi:hypothetical protein
MVKSQDNRFSTIFPDASFCWFVDEFEVEISEMERVINWLARSRKKEVVTIPESRRFCMLLHGQAN